MSYSIEPFSLYSTIEDAAGTMVLKARDKKIRLNLHLRLNEDLLVCGDEFNIRQIIINLIDNAVSYTELGEINITASVKPSGEGYLAFIEVADMGNHIPDNSEIDVFNDSEKIGEYETIRRKPGIDRSLPIRNLIEQQGGKIYFETTPTIGLAYTIELPFAKPPERVKIPAESVPTQKIASEKTILLADDDHFSVLLIKAICKKHNIKVLSAENGEAAFDLALKSDIDLILTDINMPVLSGLDFARKLRTTDEISSIPVIAVTASVTNSDVNKIKDAGFSEILFKPFRENDLIEKISLFLH